MTIIMFLVDTSFSMNRKCYLGTTYLDIAKCSIEIFMKFRAKDPSSKGDRYMLLTTEEYPFNIKAGWRENHATFMQELKALKATTLTNLGQALRQAFDLLNINRLMSGIDTYGQGRCPFYLEYSVIIFITDGSKITTQTKVLDEIILPSNNSISGSELTLEPFRWDQKLYSLILKLPGLPTHILNNAGKNGISLEGPSLLTSTDSGFNEEHHTSPLDNMCEATGGKTVCVTTHTAINLALEWLLQRLTPPRITLAFGLLDYLTPPSLPHPPATSTLTPQGQVIGGVEEWLLLPPPPPPLFSGDVDMRTEDPRLALMFRAGPAGRGVGGDVDERLHHPPPPPPPPPSPPKAAITPSTPIFGAEWWRKFHRLSIYVNPANSSAAARNNANIPGHGRNLSNVCHWWPIPEAYWPDLDAVNLPARQAIPNITYDCTPTEVRILEGLPFDKYELETCPLTQQILQLEQPPASSCWRVFMPKSLPKDDLGHPFGYLKPSTNLSCVNLYILPYNYPVLIPLLEELMTSLKYKPTLSWKAKFDAYLKQTPPYYAGPLRKAFQKMGIQSVIPDSFENCLSYAVISYLKKIKNQAKIEYDQLIASVGLKPVFKDFLKFKISFVTTLFEADPRLSAPTYIGKILSRTAFSSNSTSESNKHRAGRSNGKHNQQATLFSLNLPEWSSHHSNGVSLIPLGRNPFDVDRGELMLHIRNLRKDILLNTGISRLDSTINKQPIIVTHLLSSASLKVYENQVPIVQMGNYQEYIKKAPPALRDIEITPTRQHLFGNPFKVDKRMMMVDEADEWMVSAPNQQASLQNITNSPPPTSPGPKKKNFSQPSLQNSPMPFKRRRTASGFAGPGPIPLDYVYVPSHMRRASSVLSSHFSDDSNQAWPERKDVFEVEQSNSSYETGGLYADGGEVSAKNDNSVIEEERQDSSIIAGDLVMFDVDQEDKTSDSLSLSNSPPGKKLSRENGQLLFEIMENATAEIFYFPKEEDSREGKRSKDTRRLEGTRRLSALLNAVDLQDLFDDKTYRLYLKLRTRCSDSLKTLGQDYTMIHEALFRVQHDPILTLYLLKDVCLQARRQRRQALCKTLEQSMKSLYEQLAKLIV